MDNKDVAIYYRKCNFGRKDMFLLKPIKVIQGNFDQMTGIFTSNNNKCYKITRHDVTNGYLNISSIDNLKTKYGEDCLENDLLTKFFIEETKKCYMLKVFHFYNDDYVHILEFSMSDLECIKNNILNNEVDYAIIPLEQINQLRNSRNLKFNGFENSIENKQDTNYQIDNNKKSIINAFPNEIDEITAYSILGLDDGEYTYEDVLIAAKKMLAHVNSLGMDNQAVKGEIDCILDAYNEIVTPWQGKCYFYKKRFR